MTARILAVGSGGHFRVLLDAIRLGARAVEGACDANQALHGTVKYGVPVLGDDSVILAEKPGEVELLNAIGSTTSMARRRHVFVFFKERGYTFVDVIHPRAIVASDSELSEGVQILAGAVIQAGVRVGKNTIVNTSASVDHDCVLGAHVHVAPGATLSGAVVVEDSVHIGTGATIIEGIHVGAGATVAAGAVVVDNVLPGAVVMGVPAKMRPA